MRKTTTHGKNVTLFHARYRITVKPVYNGPVFSGHSLLSGQLSKSRLVKWPLNKNLSNFFVCFCAASFLSSTKSAGSPNCDFSSNNSVLI